jgi:hypothetical protein
VSPTPPATPATVVSGVLFQFLDTSVQHTSTAMLPVLTALLLAGAEPSSYRAPRPRAPRPRAAAIFFCSCIFHSARGMAGTWREPFLTLL